jgi:hypothetical protein
MLGIKRKDGLFDYKILLQNISLQIHEKNHLRSFWTNQFQHVQYDYGHFD